MRLAFFVGGGDCVAWQESEVLSGKRQNRCGWRAAER